MIIADLETDQLDLAEGSHDLILCPDVIEHLIDPAGLETKKIFKVWWRDSH